MMVRRGRTIGNALKPRYGGFLLGFLLVGFLLLRVDLKEEREVPVSREETSWVMLHVSGSAAQFCRVRGGDVLARLLEERAPELVSVFPRGFLERPIEGGTEVRIELGASGQRGSLTVAPLAERCRFLLGMPINVNRANQEELALLPGIGPKLAERIILARETMGSFSSCEDLLAVHGIGNSLVRRIRDSICFSSPPSRFLLRSERPS